MIQLTRGYRAKLEDYFDLNRPVDIVVKTSGNSVYDTCCMGIDMMGKMSDDRYVIFEKQNTSPDGAVIYKGNDRFSVNILRIDNNIGKLIFAVCIDGSETMDQINSHIVTLSQDGADIMNLEFSGSDFNGERAVVSIELYLKTVWRIGVTAAGFAGGFEEMMAGYSIGLPAAQSITELSPAISDAVNPEEIPAEITEPEESEEIAVEITEPEESEEIAVEITEPEESEEIAVEITEPEESEEIPAEMTEQEYYEEISAEITESEELNEISEEIFEEKAESVPEDNSAETVFLERGSEFTIDTDGSVYADISWNIPEGVVHIECDGFAVLLSGGKLVNPKDVISFSNPEHISESVSHLRYGSSGSSQCERISADLSSVPQRYDSIIIAVSLYMPDILGHHAGELENLSVSISDHKGNVLCRYKLTDDRKGSTAVVTGAAVRKGNAWIFRAADFSTDDRSINKLAERFKV